MDLALRGRRIAAEQSGELVEVCREVVPVRHAGEVDVVHAVGQQNAVEAIEATEAVVRLQRDVPAGAPPAREREIAFRHDAPAEAVKILLIGKRRVQIAAVLIDAGELNRVLPIGEPLPPVAHPEDALSGHIARMEGEVVRGCEGEIVRNFGEETKISRGARGGRQKAGLALHGRVGVLEVGQAQDRYAEHFELRIFVADGLSGLIMGHGTRRDAPERGLCAIGFARREPAVLELRDVAVAADRLLS